MTTAKINDNTIKNNTVYYTSMGYAEFFVNGFPATHNFSQEKTLAIKVTKQANDRTYTFYYLRLCPGNKIYHHNKDNPSFAVEKVSLSKFFLVSQECFEQFLFFLKTGNPVYLRNAEMNLV